MIHIFLPQFLKINNVLYQKPLNCTLRGVNCMVWELYLNIAVFKKDSFEDLR